MWKRDGLTQMQASVRQRGSVTSTTLKMQRTRTDGSNTRLRSNSNLTSGSMLDEEEVVHEVEPRARTAMLPPVMVSATQGAARGSTAEVISAGEKGRRASAVLARVRGRLHHDIV